VGDRVPEFTVHRLSGEAVSLGDFRGKNVFVHFWATWCPPCLVELPALARLSARLEQGRFAVLAVCVDRAEPNEIKLFLERGGYDLPVYLDPGGRVAASFGTFKFPETYLVGPDGIVVEKVIGPGNWDAPSWERFLQNRPWKLQ
jgi:peroxiredoxin